MMEAGELTFTRVHEASPEVLFDCMTTPEHLTHFWGPTGTTTPIDHITVDLRPGGVFETTMISDADGSAYTMRAVYTDVRRPDLLAWTESDVEGGMLTTVTFIDLDDGRTEVVTHQTNVPTPYLRPEAQVGFKTSLDRFDAYVAELDTHQHQERAMPTLTSSDGTTIAYERSGSGPAIVLIDGAMCYRAAGPMRPLAQLLSEHFTVYAYDRRGRGESTDTTPYTVDREVEDLQALVAEAGGTAFLYSMSSGGALALATAVVEPGVAGLALYEPPFLTESPGSTRASDYTERLREALVAGKKADAVALFMAHVGMPAQAIDHMRGQPGWSTLEAIAPTLAYDDTLLAGGGVPLTQASAITVPTVVVAGTASPEALQQAARETAASIPTADLRTLDGQTHDVDPAVLAPVLVDFFLKLAARAGG